MLRQSLLLLSFTTALLLSNLQPASAARIEADKGKKYNLTKKHGPWMIMVATFREPHEEAKVQGKSPEEAADELVYELRRRGIPAYSFRRNEAKGSVRTIDRLGRDQNRIYRLDEEICVIAGNYNGIDNDTGQKTLAWIKKFEPKCLEEGGIYRKTPGRPGPLSGAFLTVNPLLSPDEVLRKRKDPLILRLNSGFEHSLLKNDGKYSVIVATFQGKSVTKMNNSSFKKALSNFQESDSLDNAGFDAWRLTQALRDRDYEAYVYHDRYRSLVTIGSFDSEKDPGIQKVKQLFGAQWQRNKETGKMNYVSEFIQLPAAKRNQKERLFVFDPQPTVMEVPNYR